jgi:hypothetical protein
MNEKTDNIIGEERIEQARGNESNLHQFRDDKVEHTVVFSVPLADALAQGQTITVVCSHVEVVCYHECCDT